MNDIKINRSDIIHAIESEVKYIHDIMADSSTGSIGLELFYQGKESAYLTVLSLLKEEGGSNMDG